MRTCPSKIAILCLLALLATAPLASAVGTAASAPPPRNATGGATPTYLQHAGPEDVKDPNISQPKEPGVENCVADLTQEDAAVIRDNAGIKQLSKKCLPQQDSFKSAAEAASYLAIYQQHFSDYGVKTQDPDERAAIRDAVNKCLSGDPSCDDSTEGNHMKARLFQALVQYNFGKEIKAELLENQTRAANMATMDLPPEELKQLGIQGNRLLTWNDRLQHKAVKENTFRLDPRAVKPVDPEKLSPEEHAQLGSQFGEFFNSFVNEYTSSTGQRGPKSRWSYVYARTAAVGGNGSVSVIQTDGKGKAYIDKGRLTWDVKTQDTKVVNEIIDSYRKDFKDVLAKPLADKTKIDHQHPGNTVNVQVDSMKRAFEVAGFGLPESQLDTVGQPGGPKDAAQIASQIVLDINKTLTVKETAMAKEREEMDKRNPASAQPGVAKAGPPPSSVTVDVAAFDKFLDDIWPPAEKRPPN